MLPPFPVRFLVAFAALSSTLWTSSDADEDVEMSYSIGGSVTLTCPRKNAGNPDYLMKWSIGSRTIFEDGDLTAGIEKGERYKYAGIPFVFV